MSSTSTEEVFRKLERALSQHFSTSSVHMPTDSVKYAVDEVFGEKPYWKEDLSPERFDQSLKDGILFRPAIVDKIVGQIETILRTEETKKGLMICGPQGIGKSHSLLGVVGQLESSNHYLVTYFSNCREWDSATYFLEILLRSFGVISLESIGIDSETKAKLVDVDGMRDVIRKIDAILDKLGKQWVFVFDQVNALFTLAGNRDAKTVDGLAYPFNLVARVRKVGRIVSVISASANNELSYRDNHPGFLQFQHPTSMTEAELLTAFGNGNAPEPSAHASDNMELEETEELNATSAACEVGRDASEGGSKTAHGNEASQITSIPITQDNVGVVIEHSGGVPLYAKEFAQNAVEFQGYVDEAVDNSINNLYKNCIKQGPRDEWEEDVRVAIFSSLLQIKARDTNYDKKFLLKKVVDRAKGLCVYEPLFPAVEAAYRKNLWKALMSYVAEKESTFLEICADGNTTNDTRGRLFEMMVIRRCQAFGVKFLVDTETADFAAGKYELFRGRELLRPVATKKNTMYIPTNPNFKAIDWFWTMGTNKVVAVQAHVNAHDDVISAFWGMAVAAGWLHHFDHVELLYLSPEDATVDLVHNHVSPPTFSGRASGTRKEEFKGKTIFRRALSRLSINTLVDLQWPDGCSLQN